MTPTLARVEQLHALATRAAAKYRHEGPPLSWRAALAAATPRRPLPPEEDALYRDSFAHALVRLGKARAKGGKVSGPSSRAKRKSGARVEIVMGAEEHKRCRAKAAGEGRRLSDVGRELLVKWSSE